MTFFVSVGALGYLAVIVLAILYAFWPSLRYSHKRAKHSIDLTQTEEEVAPEYKWATDEMKRSYKPFEDDYRMGSHEREFWRDVDKCGPLSDCARRGHDSCRDWRTQTFDSLSPESLDSTSNQE